MFLVDICIQKILFNFYDKKYVTHSTHSSKSLT